MEKAGLSSNQPETQYRLIGKTGDFDVDCPADIPDRRLPMRFVKYITDSCGAILGAAYLADYGHGYGFWNGNKPVTILLGEEFSFRHEYTSTTDGEWVDGSYLVTVRIDYARKTGKTER